MMNHTRPLGLDPIIDYIDRLRPQEADDRHYIIYLDTGSGVTTLTEFLADTFMRNRIRHFGSRERYLEYQLDGSLAQIRQILEDIDANACYTNHYEGIIALNIAGLARYVNQAQTEVFLKALPGLGKHATLVFFAPTAPNRNLDRLVERIHKTLDDVMVFRPAPYNASHLAGIILRTLDENGVLFDDSAGMFERIQELVQATHTVSIRDARRLAQKLGRCADRTGLRPVLRVGDLYIPTEESTPIKMKEAI